jgi:hypothetical protein
VSVTSESGDEQNGPQKSPGLPNQEDPTSSSGGGGGGGGKTRRSIFRKKLGKVS